MLEAIASDYFRGQYLFGVIKHQGSKKFEASGLARQFAEVGIEIKPPHRLERDQVEDHSIRRRGAGRPEELAMRGFIWRAADLWDSRGKHVGTATGQCPNSPFQRFCGTLLPHLNPDQKMPSRKFFRKVIKAWRKSRENKNL